MSIFRRKGPDEGYTPTSAPIDPLPPQGGSGTSPKPPVEVGDDEITKRERAMGLDINEKTGRAYKDQGDFHNLGLQAGGHFRDGNALPSAFTCAACSHVVVGKDWRAIYDNCSAITCGSLRFDVEFHICRECTLKVLNLFPNIKGMMAAMHGGDLKRG